MRLLTTFTNSGPSCPFRHQASHHETKAETPTKTMPYDRLQVAFALWGFPRPPQNLECYFEKYPWQWRPWWRRPLDWQVLLLCSMSAPCPSTPPPIVQLPAMP